MPEISAIDKLVSEIARKHLSDLGVEAVHSEPAVDSQGKDALRITITITSPDNIPSIGDKLLDTLFEIQTQLAEKGEERFPIIEYATKDELEAVDDSES